MKTEIEWTSVEDCLPDPGERVIASNGFFSGEAYIGYRGGEPVWFRHYGFTWEETGIMPPDRWAPCQNNLRVKSKVKLTWGYRNDKIALSPTKEGVFK